MAEPCFNPFRLVGGTALSLQIGHRESVDIDLFTEADYGSVDFATVEAYFKKRYAYVETSHVGAIGPGTSYFVGHSEDDAVKVDIYYTDPFIREEIMEEGIRMTAFQDIIAMKLEVTGGRSRKKDFWDLHALQDEYSITEMIGFYQERYPFNYTEAEIRAGLVNFSSADEDPDPFCLMGKYWELIKFDFINWLAP
ncbi:MAG: nucleotidyl transferase AbiEii/AbiGii toxin family protein [Sphingobacteriales bacterium]|nr:nucleotidyl transferase AbiEii/AbiGii toxin family protein [Sphingobacteriales bacterium]